MVKDYKDFKSDNLDKEINNLWMDISGISSQVYTNGVVLVTEAPSITLCVVSIKCNISIPVESQKLHYYM